LLRNLYNRDREGSMEKKDDVAMDEAVALENVFRCVTAFLVSMD